MRPFRLLLVAALVAGVVVLPVHQAAACSCVEPGDLRDALQEADGAFVGSLVHVDQPTPVGGLIGSGQLVTWTFEVEEALRGDIGAMVDVRSPTGGESCGFEVREGQRVGVFLDRTEEGEWTGGLCTQVDPDLMLAAGRSLPLEEGGPPAFLVAGSFGPSRMAALDAEFRTVAYHGDGGTSSQLEGCPGDELFVEAVALDGRWSLAVWAYDGFELVRQVSLPPGQEIVEAIRCLDEGATRIAYGGRVGSAATRYVVGLAQGLTAQELYRGPGAAATFAPRHAFVATDAEGGQLVSVHLDTGDVNTLPAPDGTRFVQASSDGTQVALVTGTDPDHPDGPLFVLRTMTLPEGELSAPVELDRGYGSWDVVWLPDGGAGAFPDGGDTDTAVVTGPGLREPRRLEGWGSRATVVVDGMAYGVGSGRMRSMPLDGSAEPREVASFEGVEANALLVIPEGAIPEPEPSGPVGPGAAPEPGDEGGSFPWWAFAAAGAVFLAGLALVLWRPRSRSR